MRRLPEGSRRGVRSVAVRKPCLIEAKECVSDAREPPMPRNNRLLEGGLRAEGELKCVAAWFVGRGDGEEASSAGSTDAKASVGQVCGNRLTRRYETKRSSGWKLSRRAK